MTGNAFVPFLHQLADAARAVIRPYFREEAGTEQKTDNTPVTIADREAEQAVRTLIERYYPQHGIIGEEFGKLREDGEYVWIIDPIDGTKSFIIGRPIFGTLIALAHRGKPVLGVIDQPIIGDRWLGGAGVPTTLNGKLVRTRSCANLAAARVATTGPSYFAPEEWQRYQQIIVGCQFPVWGGDCYNYGLLASGGIDIVIESGLKTHDFMALAAVVEGAGGLFTDWRGAPVTLASGGQVIAAGDAWVHQEVLGMLR